MQHLQHSKKYDLTFSYITGALFLVSFMIIHQQASLSFLILMGTVDSAFSSIDLQGGPKNLGINGDHGATLSRVKCPQLPYLFSAIYRVLYTL